MADTAAASGLTVQQWDEKFFTEFLSGNRFTKEMGTNMNSMIQVKEDLTKKKGDKITFALINKLANAATTGSSTLEGNEEDMTSRSHAVTVDQRRNAVRVALMEEQQSAIPLRNAARPALMDWKMEDFRDQIIAEMGSINGTAYASAGEAAKDAWLVDNADRVLFGALLYNGSSGGDHSAGLGNIDNTADKLTSSAVSFLKRIAKTASPKIRPMRVNGDEQWYTLYVGSLVFRDLQTDTTILSATREAWTRGPANPLFTGGDLIYDGVIIKEVEDFPVLTGVGAGSIDVSRAVLCGAQAIGVGIAKRPETVDEDFDYKDKMGIAVREVIGVEKMTFGSGSGDTDDQKDHGMVTGYFAAVADS